MASKLDMSEPCGLASKAVNSILGCVNRTKETRMMEVVIALYSVLPRSYSPLLSTSEIISRH